MSANDSNRWWEFYFVRYAMGTVVGGVIVTILFSSIKAFNPLLFGLNTSNITGVHLALTGVYGLAFCYISSAPILITHTSRFDYQNIFTVKSRIGLVIALLLPALPVMLARDYVLSGFPDGLKTLLSVFLYMFISLIFVQMDRVIACLFDSKRLIKFYIELDSARMSSDGDIVNSYKHIREHGNSFLIVLAELIFGLWLYVFSIYIDIAYHGRIDVGNIYASHYGLFLVLWVMPAAIIYYVGQKLEREFIQKQLQVNSIDTGDDVI